MNVQADVGEVVVLARRQPLGISGREARQMSNRLAIFDALH